MKLLRKPTIGGLNDVEIGLRINLEDLVGIPRFGHRWARLSDVFFQLS